jgi:hypothetical protein
MAKLLIRISDDPDAPGVKIMPASDGSRGLRELDEAFGLYWRLRDDLEAFAQTVEQRLKEGGPCDVPPPPIPRPRRSPKGTPAVPVA